MGGILRAILKKRWNMQDQLMTVCQIAFLVWVGVEIIDVVWWWRKG